MDKCMHTSEFVSMDQWMEGKIGKTSKRFLDEAINAN